MLEVDIAYCAGLFEGEGCLSTRIQRNYRRKGIDRWGNINIKKPAGTLTKSKCPQFRLIVDMTDLQPLQKLQSVFGGHITGPTRKKLSTKPVWHYGIYAREMVLDTMNRLWQYLSPRRREQAFELYYFFGKVG